MDDDSSSPEGALRELLKSRGAEGKARDEAERLLRDFQLHQLELERQNRELREARRALEESRNRYADLYDFAPVAYCTLSQSGVVEELNFTAAALLGVAREAARGRVLTELAAFDQPEQFWQHLGQCAGRQKRVVSELTLRVGARSIDVEAVSVPTPSFGQRGRSLRTAFTDITRRKRAEAERERAHRSEHERLSLLEQVGRELNRSHDRESAKHAITRILANALPGFADSAAFYLRNGDAFELVRALHPDSIHERPLAAELPDGAHGAGLSRWLLALANGAIARLDIPIDGFRDVHTEEPPYALACSLRASSLVISALCVRDQNIAMICFGRGPERAAFTRTEQAWVQEIATRCGLSLDNAGLFEELRAAVDLRETLLATISHDLKSPLNAISLSASSLLPEAPIQERRKSRRQVELIRRSANYMNSMINDLLLERLLETGSIQLETSEEPVLQLLADACEMWEPLAMARGLTLEHEAEPSLPNVVVDKERVLRVFSNLIGNAAKFSPRGTAVRVSARMREAQVTFAVADQGPGIAPEQQDQLFERYWRGSKGPRGLGLGLYIAKSIVEAHGGRIWVDSRPGSGATFWFTVAGPDGSRR